MQKKLYRKFDISEDKKLLFYSGVIDVVLTLLVQKSDPLGIAKSYDNTAFIVSFYFVVFCIPIWMCVCIHNELIEKRKRADKKLLDELSSLLVFPAGLRQKVVKHYLNFDATMNELKKPIDDFQNWYDEVLSIYRNLDYQRAEIWNTIEIEESDFVKTHGKYAGHLIDLIDTKMKKLKMDINYFSKLMDSYKWR